jgi:hypothetical protein
VAAPARAAQAPKRPASGLGTARAGITRLRPESLRGQLARALGLQRRTTPKRARRASMTSM